MRTRAAPPRFHTAAGDEELRVRWARGETAGQLADLFDVLEETVRVRVQQLGLPARRPARVASRVHSIDIPAPRRINFTPGVYPCPYMHYAAGAVHECGVGVMRNSPSDSPYCDGCRSRTEPLPNSRVALSPWAPATGSRARGRVR